MNIFHTIIVVIKAIKVRIYAVDGKTSSSK